ncbi:MAG TPA: hypothetical protein VGG25_11690 [Streptosporangiaceae bacterium]|jgi:hypothetical protein
MTRQMRASWLAPRPAGAVALPLLVAGVAAGLVPVTAAAAVRGPAASASSITTDALLGVATLSSRAAWAVGSAENSSGADKTVILRWNGTSWKRQPSPVLTNLRGVAASSTRNAWAVGSGVIMRWNGTAWTCTGRCT